MNYYVICGAIAVSVFVLILIISIKSEKSILQKKTKQLKDLIQKDMDKYPEKSYRLEPLLKMKILNSYDYEELLYQYHGGLLRTPKEMSEHRYSVKLGRFDRQRHTINAIIPTIFSVITFLIFFFILDAGMISAIIALIPTGFAFILGCIIGYSINISYGKDLGFQNEPVVHEEVVKRRAAIASGIACGVSTYKATKKAIKELSNPDCWSKSE